MTPGDALLVDLTVEHGYFAHPERCRLDFRPDAPTVQWLRRAQVAIRATDNRLRLYCTNGRDFALRPGSRAPAVLGFAATTADPLFGIYTDGLDMPAEMVGNTALERVGPVFDLANATPDTAGVLASDSCAACCPLDAGPSRPANQGFRIALPLPPPEGPARAYRIRLHPRAVVWKYLLDRDSWNADSPRIAELEDQATAPSADRVSFSPGPVEPLADGREALTILSDRPLALSEHSPRRIGLWADAGMRSGQNLIPVLPNPSAANLARAGSQPRRMIAEILVPR